MPVYTPRTWVEGDKGKAVDLNHIEGGIDEIAKAIGLGLLSTATQPLSGTCASEHTYTEALEWLFRIPIVLPVATTRWRLRLRNFNCSGGLEEAGGANAKLESAYLGTPKWDAGRWKGALTGAPTKVLGATTIGTSADAVTAWVEEPTQQFARFAPLALSLAVKHPAIKVFYDEFGPPAWTGAGALAKAAEAGEPTGLSTFTGTLFDIRLEYEYVPATATGVPSMIGLVIGDSVSSGYQNTDGSGDGGAYQSYESWPGVASLRQAHPIVNLGTGSATTGTANVVASKWVYARANLTTTVPNYAIVALGVNDINLGFSLATLEFNINALVKRIQTELGIPAVYLATVHPCKFGAAKEKIRNEYNAFLRSMPAGVQGVVDFDKQLTLAPTKAEPEPSEIDPSWGVTSETKLHLRRGAYQRMAGALLLP